MKGLDGLHCRGGAGRRNVEALALEDHERARVGPAGHVDGNTDVIEAGNVGQSRNAKSRQEGLDPG